MKSSISIKDIAWYGYNSNDAAISAEVRTFYLKAILLTVWSELIGIGVTNYLAESREKSGNKNLYLDIVLISIQITIFLSVMFHV